MNYFKKYFKNKVDEVRNYGKKKLIIRLVSIICTIILATVLLCFMATNDYYKNDYNINFIETNGTYSKLVKAKVLSIDDVYYPHADLHKSFTVCITFSAKVLSGSEKGKTVSVKQYLNDYTSNYQNQIKDGQRVYIARESTSANNEATYYFSGDSFGYDHWIGIIILIVILCLLLVIVSDSKGLLTIVSMIFTILVFISVFLPRVLLGNNIYLLTMFVCLYVIFITYALVVGLDKKFICASLGAIFGLAVSGLLTIITLKMINATGHYVQEDISEVTLLFQTFYNIDIILDLKGIIFASTILGSLGAVMDVSLSLSSALKEVYDNSIDHSILKTIKSGFNIGKDMIGTMVNTLVLAYVSCDLAFLLFFMSSHSDGFVMQSEYIAIMICQSLIGAIAMVLTIVLTSIVCALIYNKKNSEKNKIEGEDFIENETI